MQDENLLKFFEKLIDKEDERRIIRLIFTEEKDEKILEMLLEEKKVNE